MFGSKHSSMNKTGAGMGLRASELNIRELANASYDISDQAKAQRAAEEEARKLQAEADAAAAAAAAGGGDSSSSAAPAAPRLKPEQQYRLPDGSDPHLTWPGEKTTSQSDNSIHYTESARLRDTFVRSPEVFDRFPGVNLLGIAPGTFAIDLEDSDVGLAAIQKEMNMQTGAPSLANIYDVDKVKDAPRFWAKWPGALNPLPRNDQMTRSYLRFALPLSDAATVLDWHAWMCAVGGDVVKSGLPLLQEPGSIEDTGVVEYADPSVPVRSRAYHSTPVAIKVHKVRNTSGVDLDVDLQVPNMQCSSSSSSSSLHVSHSEPLGVCSSKRTMTASDKDDRVYFLRPDSMFNSPEARRWASIDREAELAKFTANEDGNDSYTNVGEKTLLVVLTPTPRNLVQFMVTSYASQLYTAAENLKVSRPLVNPTGITPENPYGHVAVVLDTVVAVFNHFCDLYCPSKYAVNQHQWSLAAKPSNAATNLATVFKTLGLRDVSQADINGAQLSYVLEVIQLPYDGVQRVSPAQSELLKSIDKNYAKLMACAGRVGVTPQPAAAQPVFASNPSEVWSAVKPARGQLYPPSRG